MTIHNVVIIGAGAAGLAAARTLADQGITSLVVEARDRIGGRVWTDHQLAAVPVERGAEFIHGSTVETWRWLKAAGLHALPFESWSGREIALSSGRLAGSWILRSRSDLRKARMADELLAQYRGPDRSLADWMTIQRFSPLARHLLELRIAHACCATAETLSVAELAFEAREGGSDEHNYHIAEGYDFLMRHLALGLQLRLTTPVLGIRWDADGAEIETTNGSITARHVIVTLPLALLKRGSVAFHPALPEAKRQAISRLEMPPAMKLIYRFREPFWKRTMTILTADDPVPVWWTVRPGEPLLLGFATGYRAARLATLGPEAALQRGLDELGTLFGSAPARLFEHGEVVDWAADPWAAGGYSSVPPGAHGQRQPLADACGSLHFAGEATVTNDNPSTVHGAIRSGQRAAAEVIAALEQQRD